MTLLDFYYFLKPLLPRWLQIMIRRNVAAARRKNSVALWPIDPRAGNPPSGWKGWPEKKRFALVLNHDVDTAKGHDRCERLYKLEKKLGFRSAYYFVPEDYQVAPELRCQLQESGFEVGVHGLLHDGKMYASRRIFEKRARRINAYLKAWGVNGFSSPSMHRKLEWTGELDIKYDISTFDTDPFEPQPEGVRTIFPFWYQDKVSQRGFIEIPYTMPQDHTLFIILREVDIRIWMDKVDWIAEKGGMALLITHPDYMRFDGASCLTEEYPVERYLELLAYIKSRYSGQYWQPLAGEMAQFWLETYVQPMAPG